MGLAESVPAGDERDRLLVVHGHPSERLADVPGRGNRVRIAVRPLGVHVDQAHLHRAERIGKLPVAAVALVAEPGVLGAPVDVLLGLPDVLASAAETERLEAHRLQRAVPGQDHQVGPRDLPAVVLLDRPEQAAGLVEVGVVGPAVERGEALRPRARTASSVVDAVGAGAVPRHADEQRAVVAEVSRPPVLRRRHQLDDVGLQRHQVEGGELGGVIEALAHRVDQRRVLRRAAAGSAGPATSAGSRSEPLAAWAWLSTGHLAAGAASSEVVAVGPVSSWLMVLPPFLLPQRPRGSRQAGSHWSRSRLYRAAPAGTSHLPETTNAGAA